MTRRSRASRTVHEVVLNGAWAEDIGPDLDALLLQDFFKLWMLVAEIDLQENTSDTVRWAWENDGKFSMRSAYASKFWGREVGLTADFMWKSREPLQCRFFA